jgi:hypothetical protein
MENAVVTKSVFKPRARIMLQLGEQLIKNESIALLELIKNSYDADARTARVIMSNVDNMDIGTITIEDDGIGMDIDIIKNVWMEPGSDYKALIFSKKQRTDKFHRLPLGEKGIGRFGAHKLGNTIELVTRMEDKQEIYVKIDWSDFAKSQYLNDVKINIYERKPLVFNESKTGTRIIIKNLKETWTRGMVRDIYRSINSLCSPFSEPRSFRVSLDLCERADWLEGLLSWEDIEKYALYKVKCTIDADEIKKFTYDFIPWTTMTKLEPRTVTEEDKYFQKVKKMVQGQKNKPEPLDLSKFDIGDIKFEVLIFDRTPKILSIGVEDKKGFKEYLDQNGGIYVYRDGVRVYDYGEPANDWLGLGTRRINVPTKRISNNIILGAVHLKREMSSELIEKTNREGFIENDAYNHFKAAILYALDKIETFRNPDKEKVQTLYGTTSKSEPVMSSLADLRYVVEKKVKEQDLKNEIIKYIDRIENDYLFINETLLKSAGAGLSLSIVIHEIEKIIKELLEVLKKNKATERSLYLAKHLSQLIEGYSFILRGSGIKSESLPELIDQALFNIEFRIDAHKIDVIKDYNKPLTSSRIKCARRFVINSILNIIDNSIWWMNYYGIREKKVYITISEEMKGYTSIVIADNGKGFSLPTEEIVKPFVSGKPHDMGMGIGLHIVNEAMITQKGLLVFPDWGDFSVPKEFKEGAIIALCFANKE